MEGVAAAKVRGVYRGNGRKSTIDATDVRRPHYEGKLCPTVVAKRLNIGWASVYRVLGKQEPEGSTRRARASQGWILNL